MDAIVKSTPVVRRRRSVSSEGIAVPVIFGQVKVEGKVLYVGDIELSSNIAKLRRYGDQTYAYLAAVWYLICHGKNTLYKVLVNDKVLGDSVDYKSAQFFNDGTESIKPTLTSGEKFLIVGGETGTSNYGRLYSSLDMASWTNRYATAQIDTFFGAASHGGLFVVVGSIDNDGGVGDGNGSILTSDDGSVYTHRDSTVAQILRDVIYGNSLWVAVGDAGTIVTSSDLETWGQQVSGTTKNIYSIAYSGSGYVAVCEDGVILYSTDAINWVEKTSGTSYDLYGVTFGGGKFVAVGEYGTILTSTDGDTWSSQTSDTTYNFYSVAYGNNQYVAVGEWYVNNALIKKSIDGGTTWNDAQIGSASSGDLRKIIWDGEQFITTGDTLAAVYYSASPTHLGWETFNLPEAHIYFGICINTLSYNFDYTSKLSGISHIFMPGSELGGSDLRVVFDSSNKAPTFNFVVRKNLSGSPITGYDLSTGVQFCGNNPIAVIYEILTNKQWGLGIDSSYIDLTSFNHVAGLFTGNRSYGINVLIEDASSAREVLDKIFEMTDVFIYVRDGKFYARSLFDSSLTQQVQITDDDFLEPLNIRQGSWSDVPNIYEAEYTDQQLNYEKKTVSVVNEAAVEMAGGLIRKKKINLEYFSFPEVACARLHEIMQRESYPQVSLACSVDSRFSHLLPGDVASIYSEEYGIDADFKVVSVDYPEAADLAVHLELQQMFEDIFDGNFVTVMSAQGTVPQNTGA